MSTAVTAADGGMTVISRLERLDLMLLCMEEIKAGRGGGGSWRLSSGVSTASSGGDGGLIAVTDGENSSESWSSEKMKGCRSMEEVILETNVKGSLIDRIMLLESRLLQLEENIQSERKIEIQEISSSNKSGMQKKHKGLKAIVKACVTGNHRT